MTRIRYDNPVTADNFEEHIDFSWESPYTLRIKHFEAEEIVPVHYAKTVEILVCKDLKGKISIGSNLYTLDGENQVFMIAPYVLHSTEISACDGTQYVIKLDLEVLSSFLNLSSILEYDKIRLESFQERCAFFDDVERITLELIRQDGDFLACMGLLISLIQVLRRDARWEKGKEKQNVVARNEKLRELVKWTEERYASQISTQDAADFLGYSKYYFCTYFKKLTGVSYMHYLNHVRIYNACSLLRSGMSIQDVCEAVGFESLSYFVRLFKRIEGVTPKGYAERFRAAKR